MNAGIFTVSGRLLSELLKLPPDAEVLRVRESPDVPWGQASLEVLVTHPSLPEVAEGKAVERVEPQWTHKDGEVHFESCS